MVKTTRRLGTGAVLAVFVWLNVHNWCQPGWCGQFGIPMTFRKYSDDLAELNGHILNHPFFSRAALALDVVVAVAVTLSVWLAFGVSVKTHDAT